jgi:hypothetical protein
MHDPQDLSSRAISLARAVDRLPIGEYSITLIKPTLEAKDWYVEILRTETVQSLSLK